MFFDDDRHPESTDPTDLDPEERHYRDTLRRYGFSEGEIEHNWTAQVPLWSLAPPDIMLEG
ncbi:hypothetical protein ACFLWA_10730 [Chloroflexota bacterium]